MKTWLTTLSVVSFLIVLLIAGGSFLWIHWFYTGSCSYPGHRLAANQNDVLTVQVEIDAEDFRNLLARTAGVSQSRARHLKVEVDSGIKSWKLRYGGNERLAKALGDYLSCRAIGHSAAYSRDAMALGRPGTSARPDAVAVIQQKYQIIIPPKWIHHTDSQTAADGTITTVVVVVDGEIAWSYEVRREADGSADVVYCEQIDGVEFSPEYLRVIGDIEARVDARAKQDGIHGLGSCHSLWSIKRELLEQQGIRWRSPSEMNPGSCYD